MLIRNLTYDIVKQRQKSTGELSHQSFPSEFMSNNFNNERPLKSNSNDLSFKGLSFKGENKKKKDDKLAPTLIMLGGLAAIGAALRLAPAYKKAGELTLEEFSKFSRKHLAFTKTLNSEKIDSSLGEDLLEHLQQSPMAKHLVNVQDGKIILFKKTIPQLIWDGLIYPFKILPADILNGTVSLLGKIKPLKNWSQQTLAKPFFKNIRQRSKIDAQANSLQGLVETINKFKNMPEQEVSSKIFQTSVKMFDPSKGNYDTKHERSLNRLVSGIPPAIFLANDAYNLSRMMDDDEKAASHEQKTRFKQEIARIGISAYFTLVTMGALSKYINNSKMGVMLMTFSTTLITEALSRVLNGKHITRLTPEEARLENKKNDAPEASIKPETSFKAAEKPKEDKSQKPLLSFNTLVKVAGLLIAGGIAAKGLRKIESVDKAWKLFTDKINHGYKYLTKIEDYKITQTQLGKITKVLEDNGFKDLAAKYKNVAETAKHSTIKVGSSDETLIHLGPKDKKIKPLVDFFIAPFKFIWKYILSPVDSLVKLIFREQSKKSSSPKDIDALAKSIYNIGTQAEKYSNGKLTQKQFHDYVSDNILKAFNIDSMSNLSNSELSNIAKTASTAATIWFLMTDNYNMVMLKSNGNDSDGAKTKFKERFVQESSRLFYQTLLIDLFNSSLSKTYHKSLFGMSWITATNTTIGEWLNRKSVGVPVGTHSRQELIDIEAKQESSTGFTKSYYNFMKRLTGKRAIKTYEVAPKNTPEKTLNPEIDFTSNSIFTKIIKG